MIHLANSGLAGLSKDTPSLTGELPIPGETPHNLPKNSISFSSVLLPSISLELPIEAPRSTDLPEAAIADGGNTLPPMPQLPIPDGKNLPALETPPDYATEVPLSAPQSIAQQPDVNWKAAAFASEDIAHERPPKDRLARAAAPSAQPSHPSIAAPSPSTLPTNTPDGRVQTTISSLAMAATQLLSTEKPTRRLFNRQKVQTGPTPISKPAAQSDFRSTNAAPSQKSAPAPVTQVSLPDDGVVLPKSPGRPTPKIEPHIARIPHVAAPNDGGTPTQVQRGTDGIPASQSQFVANAPTTAQSVASVEPETLQPNSTAAKSTSAPAARVDQQAIIDRTSEQIAISRETAQPNSASIRLPHEKFGQIRMQLELASAGLRVTLGNNDPGFAPSVQVALAERVSAVGDLTRADNGSARQDNSPQGNGQSASQLGQQASQHQAQQRPQMSEDPNFGEALFGEQQPAKPAATLPSPRPSGGLFA